MTEGYTGYLYEISPYLQENSGWLGGDERGWEEAPYWLRGFYDLSVLTENSRIDSVADKWIEAVINSQQNDGYYGSETNKLIVSEAVSDSMTDLWPHMVMNDVLISHYEVTKDERVIPMLTGFFRYCADLPEELFLSRFSWNFEKNSQYLDKHFSSKQRVQLARAGDFIPQIYWLYARTKDEWLLDLTLKIYQKIQPPLSQWLDHHNVHFMQRFRYPAQLYTLTGDEYYLNQSRYFYDQMMQTWGQMPRGAFAADERIRIGRIDPRQGFESCGIVEGNKSFYILGDLTGNIEYADKIEDLTFNWLPACHTPDLKAVRYFTAANMAYSVRDMDYQKQNRQRKPFHGTSVFAANTHRCCLHNTGMGWPWFVKNMWKASADNGLIAWLYGPNKVNAKVGESGADIQVISRTAFPFSDQILFKFDLEKAVHFPLYLRIPLWADRLILVINNEQKLIKDEPGRFIKIERQWRDDDEIMLEFKPKVTLTHWPRTKSVTVNRGPLSYSVRIQGNWINKMSGASGWSDNKWELLPASDWNYGLVIDKDIRIHIKEQIPDQPWDEKSVPVTLKIPARKIPGWKASVKHTVDPLRQGPVHSDEKTEWIDMIPMGAAHLRITCLPVISKKQDARYWQDIPDPNEFMLERIGD
ncbi:MAG: glycoside hydrolase family 127 protein [candidate division KSB1 bacterium]|nr:glycoside hydrolase family 127 protein [candidate division KSB1 bacterium]